MSAAFGILFDFGGTLDSDGLTWLERFHALYLRHGVECAREQFTPAFYYSDDNLQHRFDLSSLGLEPTVRLQVGCVLEKLAPHRRNLLEPVTRDFVEAARAHLQRNRPILERLRRGFRLGIVSNFYGNLDTILKKEGLYSLFDFVADSERVGAKKPDAAIFDRAAQALGLGYDRLWMVGDSLKRDMRGAEALGMRHVWLSPAGGACCPQATTIPSLMDLERCLQGQLERVA